MALQSRMQLARPRGVRLGCRVGSMGLGATKGATGRHVVGWSELTSGAGRQVHSHQARLLRLVVSSLFNGDGVNQVWHVEPDGVRS